MDPVGRQEGTLEGDDLLGAGDTSPGGADTKDGALECFTEQEVREEDITVKCGYRSCAPRSIQKCADIRAYAANTSGMLLLHIAVFTYSVGIGRTMERRFGLSSTEVNLPSSVCDFFATAIGLIVGYLGHKLHKPRILSLGNALVAGAVLLFMLPYVIYGARDIAAISSSPSATNTSGLQQTPGLCHLSADNLTSNGQETGCGTGDNQLFGDVSLAIAKRGAFACLIAGAVLIGMGSPVVATLSLPYLDENCNNENSAFYVGVVTSMYAWSPILGFLLAAICTSLPENLVGPTDLSPNDPRWIGAWWLGYLVYGIPLLLLSFPMALFPKHMKYYYIDNNKKKKSKEMAVKKFSIAKEVKNFPKECWQMCSNLPFLMLVFSKVCGLYVVTGIFLQLPRYIEIHFGQPAYIANIVSGTSGAIVGAVGNILGGYLMKRFKLGVLGSARMYVYALVIGLISILISMLLGCPQPPMSGTYDPGTNRLDVSETCNAECACTAALRPVCVNGTTTYVSPCHAGCSTYNSVNHTFSDCACAGPNVTVSEGYCTSIACGMLIPYIIVAVVCSFLGSLGRVPATMLMFRIVKKEEKAFAIGILSFALNLLCFVPSPIMFGRLFDSSCRLWEMRGGTRGACLIYDITKFRYYMHGVTLIFKVLSLLFGIIVLVLVTKQENKKKREAGDPNENKAITGKDVRS